MARSDGRLADNDGVRIAWEEHGTEHGGVPIVLVHGLGYGRWGWEPVVDRLAGRRHVVLCDNRGIGDSDAPAGPYTAAEMAGDVVAVLDAAGADRAHLVGASLGGMIVQHVALDVPDRIDRLVLVSTTPGGDVAHPLPAATRELLERMPTMDPRAALLAAVDNAIGAATDRQAIVDRILAHRLRQPQPAAGWQAQAAAGTTHDVAGDVARIAHPTLVLHGEDDRVVDPRNADVLVDRLPDACRVVLDAGGHLPMWERPDWFARAVLEFLADEGGAP